MAIAVDERVFDLFADLPLSLSRSYDSLLPTDGKLGWTWEVSLIESGDEITVAIGSEAQSSIIWPVWANRVVKLTTSWGVTQL